MISGPRDLLRRHGVDDAHFERLIDGRPLRDGEEETLLKVIYWLPDFRMLDLESWARDELKLARLTEDPEAHRGQLFRLGGRVGRVELRRPRPEVIRRFELEQYYRCELALEDPQQPAIVFSADVPNQWPTNRPIDERAGAFGLFLKFAGQDPDRPMPVFVAPRIAWYPETLLGELGMDAGLLDHVVNRTALARRRSLDKDEALRATGEREAFYAMLDAVGRAEPGQLLREARKQLNQADQQLKRTDEQGNPSFSVVPLFRQPEKQHGRLVALSGTARRVVRIRVDDPDIVARFGIDHYYEMGLFTDDSQGNPIVFCLRELPEGMPSGEGPQYRERVRVAGFFLKLWSYRTATSGRLSEDRPSRRTTPQQAPLLVGRRPVWYPHEPSPRNTTAAAIAGGLFVLVLLGIWLALWQSGRADKRFHEQTLAKTYSAGVDTSLGEEADHAEAASALPDGAYTGDALKAAPPGPKLPGASVPGASIDADNGDTDSGDTDNGDADNLDNVDAPPDLSNLEKMRQKDRSRKEG